MKKIFTLIAKNRWFKVVLAIALSSFLVLSASRLQPIRSLESGTSLNTFTEHLDKRISKLMEIYKIPGVSMALVQNREIVWKQAFGYADIEKDIRMMTDTVCRVQSISKPVTAWGVMKLVDQGKIELDTSVSYYLKNWSIPASELSQEKVTVRQLLTHTAGMPLGDILTRYAPQENMPSLKDKLTMEARLIQEPGTSFSYSNTGYNLLEMLIEDVTGLEFAMYMEQEILVPLGMTKSSFELDATLDPPVPMGYNLKGEEIPIYVYPEKASGGLFATSEDIAKFVLAGMVDSKQEVIATESIDHLYTSMAEDLGIYSLVFDAYGLGYYTELLSSGHLSVSHGGQGTGWMTHFHALPETGDAIVILTNSQRSWPFIAYVLSDWAEWNGFSTLGMEAILIGQIVLWGIIGIIWFAILLQLLRLAESLLYKKRRFAPFSKDFYLVRIVQFILFFVLIILLLWCLNQPYLNISSIFPRASEWLGISIFALALILFFSSMLPKNLEKE